MSGKVFVIADPHFGHRKVAEVRGFDSTDEHDAALVDAWNQTVDRRDVVYVLGDLFKHARMADCNGIKKLAPGNHDTRPMSKYLDLFSQVRAYYEFDGCLLSHIPVHPGQLRRWVLNVHGHTHAAQLDDRRYVNVSVEHCPGMRPRPLTELINERKLEIGNNWPY